MKTTITFMILGMILVLMAVPGAAFQKTGSAMSEEEAAAEIIREREKTLRDHASDLEAENQQRANTVKVRIHSSTGVTEKIISRSDFEARNWSEQVPGRLHTRQSARGENPADENETAVHSSGNTGIWILIGIIALAGIWWWSQSKPTATGEV